MKENFALRSPEKRFRASAIFTAPLSEASLRELRKLARVPDWNIDLSDAPELKVPPARVEIGRFYRPLK